MRHISFRRTPAAASQRPAHRRAMVVLLAVVAIALASLASIASALQPQPGQRIELRVLLIGATGNEPTFTAWKAELTREGVPFDALVADGGRCVRLPGHARAADRARVVRDAARGAERLLLPRGLHASRRA